MYKNSFGEELKNNAIINKKYNRSSLQINPFINSSARPDMDNQYVTSRTKA